MFSFLFSFWEWERRRWWCLGGGGVKGGLALELSVDS